jgi:large subunit ribosomal protein L10
VNRDGKAALVTELQDRFKQAAVALLASPNGLTVAEVTKLRRALRAVNGEFKVAKNTLARIAVQDTRFEPIADLLKGVNAFVFGYGDPIAVTKVLVKFAEENNKVSIRGGVFEGNALAPEAVDALAKLPSREVLIAQLLGLLQAPASQLLRTINEPGARVARLLDKVRENAESASAEAN